MTYSLNIPRSPIAGLLFLLFGFGLGGWGLLAMMHAIQALSWDTTQGVVTQSFVDSRGSNYAPRVEYTYAVGDRQFTGSQITFGGTINTAGSADARQTVAKYPTGKRIAVHYEPDNPSSSVLETGISATSSFAFFLGLILSGVGLFFLVARGTEIQGGKGGADRAAWDAVVEPDVRSTSETRGE